ncbi:MAG TPA: anhydro-N-acetylmuramic acid kinase [Geminicoccus sp.]|uniref:anhydro-N-acetylmuramic acid kinase n=1 Tax=Geminicoccus sp. TaxID=2024832 RepID=UPI002E33429C|nr:anhydro-N-acetylmuramic acid kinase [Geminicoccus sp.]HEX2525069.1 anhydro-N-acetylmuramic acid kinase [Geminicoccus sp.]
MTVPIRLKEVEARDDRVVLGMMSGTSMDGLDLALIRVGRGTRPKLMTLAHRTVPHPEQLALSPKLCLGLDTAGLARLNTALGRFYAEAATRFCGELGLRPDLVGLHGQTVYHEHGVTTLQIGDPHFLAASLACPVVSDFRSGDVAVGGSGAPLVPFIDRLLLSDPAGTVVALNLGGIANITILPKDGSVLGFDTGPANSLVDATVRALTQGRLRYDADGAWAAQGHVDTRLLDELLAHPFFALAPPRSTGPEQFGAELAEELLARGRGDEADLLATLTELTARSVADAIRRHARDVVRVVASGGGIHNRYLMQRLSFHLGEVPLLPSSQLGIDPDAKEAIAFALLASLRVDGIPANLPAVTGASRPVLLGRICEI